MDKTQEENEAHRRIVAHNIAIDIVETVQWPWTDRQKRLWYIGFLAGTGWLLMDSLEEATIEQLQEWHREIVGTR